MIFKIILLTVCLYVLYRLIRRPWFSSEKKTGDRFEKDITDRARIVEEKTHSNAE